MRLLVVYCHPDPESFGAAIFRTATSALQATGHELRVIDLYAEGFNPVMSLDERRSYLVDTAKNIAGVAPHVEALRWAEGWVAIYPTWFYGLPALLKGWLERVWLPGVTFQVASTDGHAALIGYALDGYGIYAQRDPAGTEASGLDSCRGHTDTVRGYHYHAASAGENMFIGCFKGQQGSSN